MGLKLFWIWVSLDTGMTRVKGITRITDVMPIAWWMGSLSKISARIHHGEEDDWRGRSIIHQPASLLADTVTLPTNWKPWRLLPFSSPFFLSLRPMCRVSSALRLILILLGMIRNQDTRSLPHDGPQLLLIHFILTPSSYSTKQSPSRLSSPW